VNRQLGALFMCSLIIAGTGNSLLSLLPVYASGLGATSAQIGMVLGSLYAAMVVGATITGRLAGEPRYRRRLFIAAGLPPAAAVFLLGHVRAVWQLALLAALVWCCGGVLTTLVTLYTGLFAEPARRGRTFGLMSLALPAGGFLGGLAIGAAADHLGYRAMFALLALVWLAPPLLGTLGLNTPAQVAAASVARRVVTAKGSLSLPIVVLLAATLLSSMTAYIGRLGLSFAMQTRGFSVGSITGAIAFAALAAAPFLPLSGVLSDRLGRRTFLLASYVLAAVGVLVLIRASALWQFQLAATLLTVPFYTNGSVAAALATDLLPALALARGLPLLGMMAPVAGIVGLTGGGYLLGALGPAIVFPLAVLPAAVAMVLLGALRYPQRVQRQAQRRGVTANAVAQAHLSVQAEAGD
jgi:MFS family permease